MIKLGVRGKILNIIKFMLLVVKSRVKYYRKSGTEFFCILGVRQGECCLHCFLKDLEEVFTIEGNGSLDIDTFKIFTLLYADGSIIFSKSAEELQVGLDALVNYCN